MDGWPTTLHELADQAKVTVLERSAACPEGAEVIDLIGTQGRTSINMKPSALKGFLETGKQRNAFELAEAAAQKTGGSIVEFLKERLKEHYPRRVDFEKRVGKERSLYYGALNAGGMGAPRYGRYCVVDRRRPKETAPDPVWIAEDSLEGSLFRDASGELLVDRLANWVAPAELAGELAAVKLDTRGADSRPLPLRICGDEDYVEAVSTTPLLRKDVEEIRSEWEMEEDLQRRALDAYLDGAAVHEEVDMEFLLRIRELATIECRIPWVVLRP